MSLHFCFRKICAVTLQDSNVTTTPPCFAHSSLYHKDRSIQFPLPPIRGICFKVRALMPASRFQESMETVVNGDLGHEERVELLGGFGARGDDVGRDFDADVQTCQDMSRHVNETVPTIAFQPSVPVPFRPPFASERWIGRDDVTGVRSLESSRSWCRTVMSPLESSLNARESIGTNRRLEDEGFAGSGLAQAPSLSGGHDDFVRKDEDITLVTADSLPSTDGRLLLPPWTQSAGEVTWNGGTISNVLGSVLEGPLAASTVSVSV